MTAVGIEWAATVLDEHCMTALGPGADRVLLEVQIGSSVHGEHLRVGPSPPASGGDGRGLEAAAGQ